MTEERRAVRCNKRGGTQQEREAKGEDGEKPESIAPSSLSTPPPSLPAGLLTPSAELCTCTAWYPDFILFIYFCGATPLRIRVSAHPCDTHSKQDGNFTALSSGPLSPLLPACASPVAQSVLGDAQGEHHLPTAVTGRHHRLRLFCGPSRRVAEYRERGGGGRRFP